MNGRAMALGLGLGVLPSALLAVVLTWFNPWFVDVLWTWLLVTAVPPGAAGAFVVTRRQREVSGRVLAVLWGVVLLGFGISVRSPPRLADTRLFVMGIDGATWNLIDSMELPHIEALQARGVRADLMSREPMLSPLLWTTMATGKVPEEHGIQGFRTTSHHCEAARFWQVAAEAGRDTGLYKWLVTWPPPEEPSFVVPAWLAPEPSTRPDDLRWVKELELSRRLKRERVEDVRPSWLLAIDGVLHGLRWSTLLSAAGWMVEEAVTRPSPERRAWRLQLLRAAIDRDAFVWAMWRHHPEVATFTLYSTDALAHTHWGAMLDGGAVADALPSAYRQADAILGEILDFLPEDVTVVVLSDHGFRAMDATRDAGRYFAPTTEHLRELLSAELGGAEVARVGRKLHVVVDESSRDAAARFIAGLTRRSTGEPLFVVEPLSETALGVSLREERFGEDVLQSDVVTTPEGGGTPLSSFVRATEAFSGEHDPRGIWLAAGQQLPNGQQARAMSLLDVAPTLLSLIHLPAARDMPGDVRFVTPQPRVHSYDHLVPDAEATPTLVNEEQLRALGYIE